MKFKVVQTIKNNEKVIAEFDTVEAAREKAKETEKAGCKGFITVETWDNKSKKIW